MASILQNITILVVLFFLGDFSVNDVPLLLYTSYTIHWNITILVVLCFSW